MLEPDLQKELKNASRGVLFVHVAMLSEPIIYVIVAFVLRDAAQFEGLDSAREAATAIQSAFILVSVLTIPTIVFLRRILLAPERLIPVGAGTERIGALYMRSQVIIDALAAVPATLGFVLFLIYGNMGMLVLFSLGSIVLLVAVFPRYEILETAVMARIMAGEAIGTPAKESLQDG